MHVDGLTDTLVSVRHVCDTAKIVEFSKNEAVILNKSTFSVDKSDVLTAIKRNLKTSQYELRNETHKKTYSARVSMTLVYGIDVWFISYKCESSQISMREIKILTNIKRKNSLSHPCHLGKAKRKSFDSSFKSTKYSGEVGHSDLCKNLPVILHGQKNFCSFVDQYSRYMHVVGISEKSDTNKCIENYKTLGHLRKYFKKVVERLHSDGVG